jgi:hypothetical protein
VYARIYAQVLGVVLILVGLVGLAHCSRWPDGEGSVRPLERLLVSALCPELSPGVVKPLG